MAIYAIGDVQGCYDTLIALINKLPLDRTKDELWLAGDLVNRGPKSLAVLRWAAAYQQSGTLRLVLGNHDLHLLRCYYGLGKIKKKDTLNEVLEANDAAELMDWLRNQPIIVQQGAYVMVHAGLLPPWTVDEAMALGAELSYGLAGPLPKRTLRLLDELTTRGPWRDEMPAHTKISFALACMTRLRACTELGVVDFQYKNGLADMPAHLLPWFAVPTRKSSTHTIVFGHWAALGVHLTQNAIALDSGCAWGKGLTAIRLNDRRLFYESAHELL